MARSATPSFVTELPLKVDSRQERELSARFQAARQLYNACLNEALVRMNLVKNCESFKKAKKLRGGTKKEKQDLFNQARKQYRFSEFDLGSFATATANNSKWIKEKLGAHEKINMGVRAFKAVDKVLFGIAKNVRFKPTSRFKSVESKTNATGITVKFEQTRNPKKFDKKDYRNSITCSARASIEVVWGKLTINPVVDWTNPVLLHGIKSPVKYCRIVWRILNGKRRWYIQLVNEGLPFQKPTNFVKNGTIGLDLNISNVAFVGDEYAGLLPFAEKVPTYEREIKALQQKMQRSMRMHNPDNFEPDFDKQVGNKLVKKKGKVKKGAKKWKRTKSYIKTRGKKAELERRKSAYSKSQNRKLVNDILRHGNRIKTERVSVKGWQKRYGKAISGKSPGFFQAELARKAESAGGKFIKFSTQTTALSQTHLDGSRIKKKLSERVHRDVTGVQPMHRDLFSASAG